MLERDTLQLVAVIALLIIVIAFLAYTNFNLRKSKGTNILPTIDSKPAIAQSNIPTPQKPSSTLPLQAYERLVILTERIAFSNLLQRIPPSSLSNQQYKDLLINQILSEFDYNLSQQIYVSQTAWQAVSNLKEQNIFIINQIASAVGSNSTGVEIYNGIVDLLQSNPQSSLHPIVLEVLRHEAQQLL